MKNLKEEKTWIWNNYRGSDWDWNIYMINNQWLLKKQNNYDH